jgi:signal transduction histidine kinase
MPSEPRDARRPPFWRTREPRGPGAWLLTRVSADGHTLHFGLDVADIERRPRTIGWLTLVAILLLTLGAYAYVRRLLAPLADIGAGAQRYGGGDFATPIPVRRSDELGDLAAQVNTMARDIHAMLDAKRALLLAISHELRSPLTRARLNAELVDEGPARDALMHDLAAMRDLITDLLESERLAAGHAALHCEPTDLGALLAALLAEHCPAAEIEMAELDQLAPLPPMPLDAPRLRLALRNLLVNAMRHGRRDGEAPRLQISLTPGPRDRQSEPAGHAAAGVWLTVRDFGPGVAPEQLDSLGQAFWRADTARQRSTGGVGLGLYLVRLVIEAHRGRLVFSNAAPGLCVEVWLPAAATD